MNLIKHKKLIIDKTTTFNPDYDIKCLSCKYYMDAPSLQIWCDKLPEEPMPKQACNKYRRTKTPYYVILTSIKDAELFVNRMQKYHLKYIIKEIKPYSEPTPSPYDLSAPRPRSIKY